MKQSLHAFMKGIIDYAGLFPPARLSLDTSLNKFMDYRNSSDSWMLSRFIIPAERLLELKRYRDILLDSKDRFPVSVLGKSTETLKEYEQYLQDVTSEIDRAQGVLDNRLDTGVLEITIPREAILANDYTLLHGVFNDTADILSSGSHRPKYVFYEAVLEENWKKDIGHILETLSKHNEQKVRGNYFYSGFKLRCGGTEPTSVPSVEQVAFALNNARNQNIAVKCTAGLHHPIRIYSDSVQTKIHGFFNIFGGAMLSYAHDLTDRELIEILADEDPDHFRFDDDAFQWRDLSLFTGEITELREVALISFGTCSFEEPREDLKQLELL